MENMEKTPRLLISFVTDNSASMEGERLGALVAAFRAFAERMKGNPIVEWELLTFDTFAPAVVKSFESDTVAPVAGERFPLLGRAVLTAAQRLHDRVGALKQQGHHVFRPWMFILSDGFTMDAMEEAAVKLDGLEKNGELLYLPFRLSKELTTERLQCLDRNKHMIEILPEGIDGFFAFVERMIEQRAALAPDVGVKFAKTDFEGWAVL
ncbi:MAG: hypothetical protein IJY50_08505 [Clostridia bacterium]|nr:hypothetical protein [Clostridia bacterium]